MSMTLQPRRLTYADYVRLPGDRRWELVEGVAHVVPSPNRRHQKIAGRLHLVVGGYVEEHGGGEAFMAPFDAVLTDIDVVQPDILFVSDADIGVLTEDNVRGNPTWVIEVLSNPYYERDKLRRYEAAGVEEHWLIDPYEDTLAISRLAGSAYGTAVVHRPPERVAPGCLPSLAVDLGSVLRR